MGRRGTDVVCLADRLRDAANAYYHSSDIPELERRGIELEAAALAFADARAGGRVLRVCRADFLHNVGVTPVVLEIVDEIPRDLGAGQGAADRFYELEAARVVDAIVSLPSGTRHKLLCRLLELEVDNYRGRRK